MASAHVSAEMRAFVTYVVPSFGILLSTCLYSSPLWSVLRIRRRRELGHINPLPYPIAACNAGAWTFYALVAAKDNFIFWSNVGGMLIAGYFTIVAYRACPQPQRTLTNLQSERISSAARFKAHSATVLPLAKAATVAPRHTCGRVFARRQTQIEIALFTLVSLQMVALYVTLIILNDPLRYALAIDRVLGSHAVLVTCLMFASPLSTIAHVCKQRDSSSIDPRLMLVQIVNCVVWTAYGFGLSLPFVWSCNVFGLLLGLAQLALVCVFPRTAHRLAAQSDALGASEKRARGESKWAFLF